MSTLRLYAAVLVLIGWAAAEAFVMSSQGLVVTRSLTFAAALFVSIRETVQVNSDRRRRRK